MNTVLKDKIVAIQLEMVGHPDFPSTFSKMAALIDETPENFSDIIHGRRAISPKQLERLHRGLGLEKLGVSFDMALWAEESDAGDLAQRIRDAHGGARNGRIVFKDKIDAIKSAMVGYPGFPQTQAVMAELIGETPSNFSHMIHGRRVATLEKLARLHQALKLEHVGIPFSKDLWAEESDAGELAQRIRASRGGDLIEAMSALAVEEPFFRFDSEAQGALIVLDQPAHQVWAMIRQDSVSAQDQIKLTIRPPITGFMKLLVIESGLVVSLDHYFGLLTRPPFQAGEEVTINNPLTVSAASPEALFVGLMQEKKFGSELPSRVNPEQAISLGRLAEWLRARPTDKASFRISARRLFLN